MHKNIVWRDKMLWSIILLSTSLSVDALALGISYGMQGVKVPRVPKLLICFSSVVYAMVGLIVGHWLLHILGGDIASRVGIFILIVMGFWMILKSKKSKGGTEERIENTTEQQKKLLEIAIKSIGITVMVIKNPVRGDIDDSGIIDIKEAILLGIALNVDATAACMGSIMVGVSSLLMPIFVGVVQLLFIEGGLYLGNSVISKRVLNEKLISILPGIILISLGLIRMMV